MDVLLCGSSASVPDGMLTDILAGRAHVVHSLCFRILLGFHSTVISVTVGGNLLELFTHIYLILL